jgi:hypothetical protein
MSVLFFVDVVIAGLYLGLVIVSISCPFNLLTIFSAYLTISMFWVERCVVNASDFLLEHFLCVF